MAESVDAPDLKSVDHQGRGSSSLPTRTKINNIKQNVMSYTVSTKNCWYNDHQVIVKMFFLNDVPFTFDDLPEGYMYDHDIVEEADKNKSYAVDDIYKGSNYLIMECCHPCFDVMEITNPENLPEDIQTFYNGEEDLLG